MRSRVSLFLTTRTDVAFTYIKYILKISFTCIWRIKVNSVLYHFAKYIYLCKFNFAVKRIIALFISINDLQTLPTIIQMINHAL